MAYTINSAKDSKGDEDQFVALANANAQAIYDYKAKHGGDFEHAFQAVTGKPWPEGRSLKMHNYQAEMTKDRTVKSVLGKYVAPIAAGVAAPFVLPALLGGGAAGGAAAAGGAGTAAGTAGATAAAAGGGSLLHSLLPTIISSGAGVAGTMLTNKANKDAAKIENEYLDKALGVQEGQRQQQRADTKGYRELGLGAVGSLGHLAGINISPEAMAPPEISTGIPLPPQPQQGGTLSTLGAPQQQQAPAGMVRMQAPDGSFGMVPSANVAAARAKGGRLA